MARAIEEPSQEIVELLICHLFFMNKVLDIFCFMARVGGGRITDLMNGCQGNRYANREMGSEYSHEISLSVRWRTSSLDWDHATRSALAGELAHGLANLA